MEDSYDFAMGPVMRTELFPMTFSYQTTREGALYLESMDIGFDGYHQFMPPIPGERDQPPRPRRDRDPGVRQR